MGRENVLDFEEDAFLSSLYSDFEEAAFLSSLFSVSDKVYPIPNYLALT